MPKKSMRIQMLAKRRALSDQQVYLNSIAVQERLIGLSVFRKAASIIVYAAVDNEIATELIATTARQLGKKVFFPKPCGTNLYFGEASLLSPLQPGLFGIPEPAVASLASISDIDLIIVPGVAFDMQGYRLCFGKGFYDRALATRSNQGKVVGLCHHFQLVPHVPHESHDVKMDMVVTERQLVTAGTDLGSD